MIKEKKETKTKEAAEKEVKKKKEKKPASEVPSSAGDAEVKAAKQDFGLDTAEMMKQGLHFGHRTTRKHPKMDPYILGIRNTVHIIDLDKTVEKFKEALAFIQQVISRGGVILFVGTKPQVKDMVREVAEECGLPYIIERWLGGTFTNFKVIRERVEYFKEMLEKKESHVLDKYTKKERAKINQELSGLQTKFEGIKNLTELPEAVFILDMKKDKLAVKEARMKQVKVIAIADTNVDPTLADYPIPANDDAISSVKYILDKVKEVILKAKTKA